MWIIENADKTSNLLLWIGGLILLLPLIGELTNKRHWDQLEEVERRHRAEGKPAAKITAIKEQFRNEMLGGYKAHRKTLAGGLLLMILGGVFLGIDIFNGKGR